MKPQKHLQTAFGKVAFNTFGNRRRGIRTRAGNIINRRRDQMLGRRPIEFIQATCPVVIVDEPQNVESEAASRAIDRLNPFCTLRYSATHRKTYNMVYRLGPIEAYDLQLVKRIEVASVAPDANLNAAFVRLIEVDAAKQRARIERRDGLRIWWFPISKIQTSFE